MSRPLIWRMWLYRLSRTYERTLRTLTGVGFGGMLLTFGLRTVAPGFGQDWQLIFLGFCLILAGTGHALLGESVSVEQYATGQSEQMPAVTKLVSGLLASAGGFMVVSLGLAQLMA